MSDRPEIDKSRTIPLYIADQAIAAADAEIQKLWGENARLKEQVERLTKAGDAMAADLPPFGSVIRWNAAKEVQP